MCLSEYNSVITLESYIKEQYLEHYPKFIKFEETKLTLLPSLIVGFITAPLQTALAQMLKEHILPYSLL